jgi:hypothetical protein
VNRFLVAAEPVADTEPESLLEQLDESTPETDIRGDTEYGFALARNWPTIHPPYDILGSIEDIGRAAVLSYIDTAGAGNVWYLDRLDDELTVIEVASVTGPGGALDYLDAEYDFPVRDSIALY